MLDIPRTPVEKNAVMSERAAPRAPPEHPSQLGLTEVGCGFDALDGRGALAQFVALRCVRASSQVWGWDVFRCHLF